MGVAELEQHGYARGDYARIGRELGLSRERVRQIAKGIKFPSRRPINKELRAKLLANVCCLCLVVGSQEIHHKDGNPLNNKQTNLRAVCRSCHRKWHANLTFGWMRSRTPNVFKGRF